MSTFSEDQHPRGRTGRFAVKDRGEAAVDLAHADASMGAVTSPDISTDGEPDASPETAEMLWCESCEEAFEAADAERLYECGSCGAKSTERRCDSCNKFMARSEEPGCPRCQEPVPEDAVAVVRDHDGEWILADDYDPDTSKAERDEAAKQAAAEKAAAEKAERLAAKQANVALVTAADLEPGAVLIDPETDHRWVADGQEVLSIRRVDTPDGPIVIFKTYDYRYHVVVRRAGDLVPTQAVVDKRPTVEDGVSAADFEGVRFVDGFDERMSSVSSPSNGVEVSVTPASRDGGTLPVLSLMAGHRGSRGNMGGSVAFIGRWDDPAQAAAALDEYERAAEAFAAARVEHPSTRSEAEDERWEARERSADWKAVTVTEDGWAHGEPMQTFEARIGLSSWDADRGALLAMRSGNGVNVSFEDPQVVRDAVAEARKHLHRLTGIPARPDVVDDRL